MLSLFLYNFSFQEKSNHLINQTRGSVNLSYRVNMSDYDSTNIISSDEDWTLEMVEEPAEQVDQNIEVGESGDFDFDALAEGDEETPYDLDLTDDVNDEDEDPEVIALIEKNNVELENESKRH